MYDLKERAETVVPCLVLLYVVLDEEDGQVGHGHQREDRHHYARQEEQSGHHLYRTRGLESEHEVRR
jgi:hypothetical protein